MNNIELFNTQNSILININNINIKLPYHNTLTITRHDDKLEITIVDNVVLTNPIYLINNNDNNLEVSINIGKNSKAILIDHKNHQNNSTYVNCQENSELDYYLIQNNDNSNLYIQQQASKLNAKILATSTTNNRLQLEINLLQKSAEIELNILQNITQYAIHDINLLVNHLINNTSSITTTRTIAKNAATANLIGKIVVHKEAKKTYANLQSKSLVLSKKAIVNSCPELDIYNNDVVCTHGSSIGNLDQNLLFYMQSRGINLEDAKQMLLEAFIEPIIQTIKYREIIEYLTL